MNEELKNKAIEYHQNHGGKISTGLVSPLDDKADLALAYSPGVGAVSLAIVENELLANTLTLKGRTVAIISDGSAVLGLGNLGALPALPVMEGKAALLKKFANVDAFPICINTQDVDEIVNIVENIAPSFGAINLEDFSAPRCFEIEERLRRTLPVPVMHDDQWGTATVVLAGLMNSLELKNQNISDIKIVISGIGAAGVAVARLLFTAGAQHITFVDSKGIITKDRPNLTKEKAELVSKSTTNPQEGNLTDAILGHDVFIGLSKPGVLSAEMIKTMNHEPIVFALANPVPEIMPDIAHSAGAFVVATGRSDFPNQVNNALVFPGILKAALSVPGCQFSNRVFLECAKALAGIIESPNREYIIPSPFDEKVVEQIYTAARAVFIEELANK